MSRATRTYLLGIGLSTFAAACGDDKSTNPVGSISLSVDTLASIVQGGTTRMTATIARTNFSSDVTLAAVGALPGVTFTFDPATLSAGATTSTLTISADQAAAVGSNTVTVRATGSGVADQTATFRLQVAAPLATGLTVTPESVAVIAGSRETATLRVSRAGGAGPLTIAADSLPDGVRIAFRTNPVDGDTTVITVAVAATVAPGRHRIPLTATGATETQRETGAVVVNVTERPAPNVHFSLCGDSTQRPIWFAAQDANGPWIIIPPDQNGAFDFHVGAKGAIGYVTQNGPDDFDITAIYATKSELETLGAACVQPPPGRTITGNVLGVAADEFATVSVGGATRMVDPGQNAVTLTNVANGTVDLLAVRNALPSFTPNAVILQRAITLPGDTLPTLDFNDPSQAFAPTADTVRLNGLGSDSGFVETFYSTVSSYLLLLGKDPLSTATVRPYYTVPLARQLPGDVTTLAGRAAEIRGNVATATRTAQLTFSGLGAKTLDFGPPLNTPNVDVVSGRIRIAVTRQPEYDKFYSGLFTQSNGSTVRSVFLGATAAYLDRNDFQVVIPDFMDIGPFNPNWGLRPGVPTTWLATAWGWSGNVGIIGPPILDGVSVVTAARTGTITP